MSNFIHEITNSNKTNCIILSAGKNKTRGEKCPKGLTNISQSKRLIDTQIDTINKTLKSADIFYAVGDQSKTVINYVLNKYSNIRIIENQDYSNTNPLHTLRLCLNCCLCFDTYVIYGDKQFGSDAISLDDHKTPVVVEAENNSELKNSLGLIYQNNTLKNISYGVDKKWGQIFYIPRNMFNDFRSKVNNLSKKYYNIFDIINLIAKDYQFQIHKTKQIKEI